MADTNNGKVYLNGYIDVPEDRLKAVKAALPTHIALTRAEEGCISFEVQPSDIVPGRFIVAEIFVDQAAFDAHQERAQNSDWFIVTKGIPREYSITVGNA